MHKAMTAREAVESKMLRLLAGFCSSASIACVRHFHDHECPKMTDFSGITCLTMLEWSLCD